MAKKQFGIFGVVVLFVVVLYTIFIHSHTQTGLQIIHQPMGIFGKRGVRAAVCYLIHQSEEENFVKSVEMLHKNFNKRFQYPVVAFYEDSYPKKQLQVLIVKLQSVEPMMQFERVEFEIPSFYNRTTDPPQFTTGGFPGYNNMIRFWFSRVVYHEAVKDLDYYFRLDTDSYIHSEIAIDPFKFMHKNGYRYAYRTITQDGPDAIVGMFDNIQKWLSVHQTKSGDASEAIADYNHYTLPPAGGGTPMLYTNFEIAHIPTFQGRKAGGRKFKLLTSDGEVTIDEDLRNKELAEFARYYDTTSGIYIHRHGDAPLRYIQLKLLMLWDVEIWHFCSIDYSHTHHGDKVWQACDNDVAMK